MMENVEKNNLVEVDSHDQAPVQVEPGFIKESSMQSSKAEAGMPMGVLQ